MNFEVLAVERFEKVHPPHVRPMSGGEPFEIKSHPSPTTDHIRVQCQCGYQQRYSLTSLGGQPKTTRRSAAG